MGATSLWRKRNVPYSITPISNTEIILHDGSTLYGVNHSANANTSIVGREILAD